MRKLFSQLILVMLLAACCIQWASAIRVIDEAPAAADTATAAKPVLNPAVPDEADFPTYQYDSKGKSDPMEVPWRSGAPLVSKTSPGANGKVDVKPADLEINVREVVKSQLTGIVYNESVPSTSSVILNGKLVKAGNTIQLKGLPESLKLTRITKNEILVTYQKKSYSIKLN